MSETKQLRERAAYQLGRITPHEAPTMDALRDVADAYRAEQAHADTHRDELLAAVAKDEARFKRIRAKLDGWSDMNGTERADFLNYVWHCECEAGAVFAKLNGGTR